MIQCYVLVKKKKKHWEWGMKVKDRTNQVPS